VPSFASFGYRLLRLDASAYDSGVGYCDGPHTQQLLRYTDLCKQAEAGFFAAVSHAQFLLHASRASLKYKLATRSFRRLDDHHRSFEPVSRVAGLAV
jgi:hypothetical protein